MDAQGLMDLCRVNEEAPDFNLATWQEPCGTFGCLVGNFCVARPDDELRMVRYGWGFAPMIEPECGIWKSVAKRFGLTLGEAEFLFAGTNHSFNEWGLIPDREGGFLATDMRDCKDRSAAIRRVRKLIYWKLKRREFIHEPDGRVRESARRLEGDHNFAAQALACF